MTGLGPSFLKIWTCENSPRSGSWNAKRGSKTSTVPIVWTTFGIFSARSKWFPVGRDWWPWTRPGYITMTRRQSNNQWSGDIGAHLTPNIPSAKIRWKICNSAHEKIPLSNDTIGSVLRHREVGRTKDLSVPPHTSRYGASSISDGVNWIFHLLNPSGRTIVLGSTQPLTQMRIRGITWGVRRPVLTANNLAAFMYWLSRNSGSLKILKFYAHVWCTVFLINTIFYQKRIMQTVVTNI